MAGHSVPAATPTDSSRGPTTASTSAPAPRVTSSGSGSGPGCTRWSMKIFTIRCVTGLISSDAKNQLRDE